MTRCSERGGLREAYIAAMRETRARWNGTGEPPLGMYADAILAVNRWHTDDRNPTADAASWKPDAITGGGST